MRLNITLNFLGHDFEFGIGMQMSPDTENVARDIIINELTSTVERAPMGFQRLDDTEEED